MRAPRQAGAKLKEAQEVRPPHPLGPSQRVPTRRKSCATWMAAIYEGEPSSSRARLTG